MWRCEFWAYDEDTSVGDMVVNEVVGRVYNQNELGFGPEFTRLTNEYVFTNATESAFFSWKLKVFGWFAKVLVKLFIQNAMFFRWFVKMLVTFFHFSLSKYTGLPCVLKLRKAIYHLYDTWKVQDFDRNRNLQIPFFWKCRVLKNTLPKGAKKGSENFGCKGVPLWTQNFEVSVFAHLPYESSQKGVPQNRGVDTEPFAPTYEQKNVDFWRFLTIFFSFFKNWHFWLKSRDERS